MRRAVQFAPGNAAYHNLLGRYLFFAQQDPEAALPHFNQAVVLNPHDSALWLDLASACGATGNSNEQQRALETAIQVDPTTPDVAWNAANFYLVRRENDKALQQFRVVLNSDPQLLAPALNLCWRITRDPGRVLPLLPKNADAYLTFITLLNDEGESHAAAQVWSRLVELRLPMPGPKPLSYVDHLLAAGAIDRAREAWDDLTSIEPSLASYRRGQANLVLNGSFEHALLNAGFDWRYQRLPNISVSLDPANFHGGSRALCISFDGSTSRDAGVQQLVPVSPDTAYRLIASVKSEELLSAHPPAVVVVAPDGTLLAQTPAVTGTSLWRQFTADFATGPNTELVAVKVVRAAGSKIQGKFWLDEVSIVRPY
ncbi:MAG: tetratricopeptide repeat protein [Terriglobales bacterium]